MKKFALVAGFALLGTVILPSCKKDYTCVCKVEVGGQVMLEQEVSLGKQKKKDAETACNNQVGDLSGSGGSVICNLK